MIFESRPRRIVIAPDSFKGSVPAAEAAEAIAAGWRTVRPHDEILIRPMADGGEGTVDAVATALPAARRMPLTLSGPDGRAVRAEWLLIDGAGGRRTALVELASAAGIELLDELRPLDADTTGFGEVVRAAIDHGVDRLLLALGGSASTDGGAGALAALGACLLDADGHPIARGNRGLASLAIVDWTAVVRPPAGGAVVLSDVDSPLLGPRGAVSVFGAQKGISDELAPAAERALAHWAAVLQGDQEMAPALTAGAGAAGGTGFGLLVWGATIASGSRVVAETIGLADVIATADLVITGEGRFDGQSSGGKAPVEVTRLAAEAGTPCMLVAGIISAPTDRFAGAFALSDLARSPTASLSDPIRWLRAAGAEAARAMR